MCIRDSFATQATGSPAAIADAVQLVWIVAVPIAVAGLLTVLRLPATELRTDAS